MNRKVSCPVCREEVLLDRVRRLPYRSAHPLFGSLTIAICEGCGCGWVLQPPSKEALRKYYQEEANRVFSFLGILKKPSMTLERLQANARWNFLVSAVEKTGKDLKKEAFVVCDIGAGYGATFEVAKQLKLAADYFAYETSPGMRKNIERMDGNVRDDFFSYNNNLQFDVVWASHILEHYPNPDILLMGMKKHMKVGGVGFIEVPYLDYKYKTDWTQHLLFFSVPGLQKAIERNGFKILRIDSVGMVCEKLKHHHAKTGKSNSLKVRLKRFLPKPLILGSYYLRGLTHLFLSKRTCDVEEDLRNKAVSDYWGTENYGGNDRCWIRAAFTL